MRKKMEKIEEEKRRLHEAMIRKDREAKGLPVSPIKKENKINLQSDQVEPLESERNEMLNYDESLSEITNE